MLVYAFQILIGEIYTFSIGSNLVNGERLGVLPTSSIAVSSPVGVAVRRECNP